MFFRISAENPDMSMCFLGFLLKTKNFWISAENPKKTHGNPKFPKVFGAPTSFCNFGNFGFRDCATENTIGNTRETSILAVLFSGNSLLKS